MLSPSNWVILVAAILCWVCECMYVWDSYILFEGCMLRFHASVSAQWMSGVMCQSPSSLPAAGDSPPGGDSRRAGRREGNETSHACTVLPVWIYVLRIMYSLVPRLVYAHWMTCPSNARTLSTPVMVAVCSVLVWTVYTAPGKAVPRTSAPSTGPLCMQFGSFPPSLCLQMRVSRSEQSP